MSKICLENPVLINKEIFYDHRGAFAPLSLNDFSNKWIQSNISINNRKFTLRGLHFQINPYAQSKLVKLIQGGIIDFVVDLRKNTENYFKLHIFKMKVGDELYVPKNFAHGFITTEHDTIVQYLVDNIYNPKAEGSIVWTDFSKLIDEFNLMPEFSIEKITINTKDLITNKLNEI